MMIPARYVGADEGRAAQREGERNPCSGILFDEIEKAHRMYFKHPAPGIGRRAYHTDIGHKLA